MGLFWEYSCYYHVCTYDLLLVDSLSSSMRPFLPPTQKFNIKNNIPPYYQPIPMGR